MIQRGIILLPMNDEQMKMTLFAFMIGYTMGTPPQLRRNVNVKMSEIKAMYEGLGHQMPEQRKVAEWFKEVNDEMKAHQRKGGLL